MTVDYRGLLPGDVSLEDLWVDWSSRPADLTVLAAHLLRQGLGDDADVVLSALEVDEVDVRSAFAEAAYSEEWPRFEFAIFGGARLIVLYRNLDEDSGVDYLVQFDSDGLIVRLAAAEGSFVGPGLAWHELTRASSLAVDDRDSAWRMLFMAPSLGDVVVGEPEVRQVARALETLGCRNRQMELAELITMQTAYWEAASWRRDDGVLVCDGDHSPRNPLSDVALPEEIRRRVSVALGG